MVKFTRWTVSAENPVSATVSRWFVMRYVLFSLLALSMLLSGCSRDDPIFSWWDADGYYTGWVYIDDPVMAFDRSFHAELRVYDNCHDARLRDDRGRYYNAYRVDYDYWNDRLKVYFHVTEYRWSPQCGHETYNWEVRMSGKVYSGDRYSGEIEADIDPEDYHSDWCWMDYNPPPRHIGTFNLNRDHYIYWN